MVKHYISAVVFGVLILPFEAAADEIKMQTADNSNVRLTVYSQNAALVQMEKKVNLPKGLLTLGFEGVAEQMQPQTSLLNVDDMKLIEKAYEYNVLNGENLLNSYIGKQVKTVRINPADGKNIYENAILLNNNFGTPLLKFDYGIEANFPGRIVFDKVPENLRIKPTLTATVNNPKAGDKNLGVTYLTNGINWNTNYVAELGNNGTLNLQAWAEVTNQSGADYKNAEIVLLSGNVNIGSYGTQQRPMMMLAAKGMRAAANSMDTMEEGNIAPEAAGSYYTYTLPERITLQDKQSKQLNLWTRSDVKIEKLYKLNSYLMPARGNKFDKIHASIVYKIINSEDKNLGLPMPQGRIRFYEKNGAGDMLLLGSSNIRYLSVNENAELNIGESFDLYAEGKITDFSKISEKVSEASYQIDFHNAGEKDAEIIFSQNISGDTKLIEESQKSEFKNAGQLEWKVKIPAKSKILLTYKLRISKD